VIDHASGIGQLEWALGTKAFATDLQSFTPVNVTSLSSQQTAHHLLSPGASVFCSLRATNRAGLQRAR